MIQGIGALVNTISEPGRLILTKKLDKETSVY